MKNAVLNGAQRYTVYAIGNLGGTDVVITSGGDVLRAADGKLLWSNKWNFRLLRKEWILRYFWILWS